MVLIYRCLASLLLGILFSPLWFVSLGVVSGFAFGFGWQFYALFFPLIGFSQYYIFSTLVLDKNLVTSPWLSIPISMFSWLVTGVFLAIISTSNLLVGIERWGFLSVNLLITFTIVFALSFFVSNRLENKLAKLHKLVAALLFIAPIGAMVTITFLWLSMDAPRFL